MQKHSVFRPTRAPSQLDLTESEAFASRLCMRHQVRQAADPAIRYLLGNLDAYKRFQRSLWPYSLLRRVQRCRAPLTDNLHLDFSARQENWIACQCHRAMTSYFREAIRARGCQRIVEKTPAHLHWLPEILATFPDAYFVVTIRHPVDTFTSYRSRLQAEQAATPKRDLEWLRLATDEFIESYRRDAAAISLLKQNAPERTIVVKYETFVAKPEDSLRRIFELIGECYESTCLVDDESASIEWRPDPHLHRKISQRTKEWRDFIDERDAAELETQLIMEMRMLGYKPYIDFGAQQDGGTHHT